MTDPDEHGATMGHPACVTMLRHCAQKDACDRRRESFDGVVFSDSAVVVVVDDMAFEFDDPDLDLDKLSEALGSPVTPLMKHCAAG